MKIPRDVDASSLINQLKKCGYTAVRQKGSHIRLTKMTVLGKHDISIPNHQVIKIGTLSNIVNDVCKHNKIDVKEFYNRL